VAVESTAADLAARIWLEAPQAMELKELRSGFETPPEVRKFPRTRTGKGPATRATADAVDELEATWNVGSWRRIAASDALYSRLSPRLLPWWLRGPSQSRADRRSAFVRYRFTDAGLFIRRTFADGCVGPMVRALAANFDSARYRVAQRPPGASADHFQSAAM